MTKLWEGADSKARRDSSGTRGVRASGHVLKRHGRGRGRWFLRIWTVGAGTRALSGVRERVWVQWLDGDVHGLLACRGGGGTW